MLPASRLLRLAPRAPLASSFPRPALQRPSPALRGRLPRLAFPAARLTSSSNSPPPRPTTDREYEQKLAQETIKPRPGEVSAKSSVRPVMEGPVPSARKEANPAQGLKHDIGIVRETFRLSNVPRESHILGLTGTVPYLATSLSTLFLSWNLDKQLPTGNAFYDAVLVDHQTAQHLLDIIEPLQLGYGAVIISFLGAIHWGLEYAEKQPSPERTRFRYGMGVAASVVAWPTLLMPVEYALTTQFMAFVALYFADSRAAARGWAPPWYSVYRFLLTAMVGFAILVSLVGRAHIGQHGKLSKQGLRSSMTSPGITNRETDWVKLEAEEKEKIKREKEKKREEEEKRKKEEEKEKEEAEKDKSGGKDSGDEKNEKRDESSAEEGKKQGQ